MDLSPAIDNGFNEYKRVLGLVISFFDFWPALTRLGTLFPGIDQECKRYGLYHSGNENNCIMTASSGFPVAIYNGNG
ncbi:MAG TPA: hypothetical protein VJ729_03585 [Nitrososphaeraceae archaeon]|nr:hypothetical protein [Nitrososphaeraceae archaeon]